MLPVYPGVSLAVKPAHPLFAVSMIIDLNLSEYKEGFGKLVTDITPHSVGTYELKWLTVGIPQDPVSPLRKSLELLNSL